MCFFEDKNWDLDNSLVLASALSARLVFDGGGNSQERAIFAPVLFMRHGTSFFRKKRL
jgi:hypothetical protein